MTMVAQLKILENTVHRDRFLLLNIPGSVIIGQVNVVIDTNVYVHFFQVLWRVIVFCYLLKLKYKGTTVTRNMISAHF